MKEKNSGGKKPPPSDARPSNKPTSASDKVPVKTCEPVSLPETQSNDTISNLTANINVTLTFNNSDPKIAATKSAGNKLKVESETASINQTLSFETAPDTLKIQRKKQQDKKEDGESVTSGAGVASKSKLFHHFDQYKRDYSLVERLAIDSTSVHPAFIKLGIEFAHDRISGSSARCIAFLNAFKTFISDFKPSGKEKKTISKELDSKLKPNIK
jgi:hypothetical protein